MRYSSRGMTFLLRLSLASVCNGGERRSKESTEMRITDLLDMGIIGLISCFVWLLLLLGFEHSTAHVPNLCNEAMAIELHT